MFSLFSGISAHELPPRFRDEGSQYVSATETSSVNLQAELYDVTKDTDIEWWVKWSPLSSPIPKNSVIILCYDICQSRR